MSNTNQSHLDPDTAYAVVHNRVYAPVFFEKLASDFNIRPASQEEALTMLTMASQLRAGYDQQQKAAAAKPTLLQQAAEQLNKKMAKMGFAVEKPAINPARIKKAAVDASFDPELSAAVLSMQAHANGLLG